MACSDQFRVYSLNDITLNNQSKTLKEPSFEKVQACDPESRRKHSNYFIVH